MGTNALCNITTNPVVTAAHALIKHCERDNPKPSPTHLKPATLPRALLARCQDVALRRCGYCVGVPIEGRQSQNRSSECMDLRCELVGGQDLAHSPQRFHTCEVSAAKTQNSSQKPTVAMLCPNARCMRATCAGDLQAHAQHQ